MRDFSTDPADLAAYLTKTHASMRELTVQPTNLLDSYVTSL